MENPTPAINHEDNGKILGINNNNTHDTVQLIEDEDDMNHKQIAVGQTDGEVQIPIKDEKMSTLMEDYQGRKPNFILRTLQQFRALMWKNILLTLYMWKSNLFTLGFSILCMLLILALKLIITAAFGDSLKTDAADVFPELNDFESMQSYIDFITEFEAVSLRTGSRDTGMAGVSPNFLISVDGSSPPSFSDLGENLASGTGYGYLGNISQTFLGNSKLHTPSFLQETATDSETNLKLYAGISTSSRNIFNYSGAYSFKTWDDTNLKYTVQYDNLTQTYFCETMAGKPYYAPCAASMPSIMMGYINNQYIIQRTANEHGIEANRKQMPYAKDASNFDIIAIIGMFLYPMILCLMVPVFAYKLVFEKVNKLRELQRLMGMRMHTYYTASFIVDYAFYWVSALGFIVFCLIAQFSFIVDNNVVTVIFGFAGWGLEVVAFSFLLSSFLNSTLVASIVGYMVTLFGPLTAILIESLVFKPETSDSWMPFMIIFPFPMTHWIVAQFNLCARNACPGVDVAFTNKQLWFPIMMMYISAAVYTVLGFYLDKVMPQKFGIRQNPCYCITCCCQGWLRRRRMQRERKRMREKIEQKGEELEDLDVDVLAEQKLVLDGKVTPDNCGVMFENLKKRFGKKEAVKGVSYAVKKNECFALLGSNGAGKSTSLNMLVGLFGPTSGTAYVNGYDIRTQIGSVYESLGYCFQHDVCWPDLSCKEHLLLFARLKGVPLSHEKRHVKEILTEVGLWKRIKKNGKTEKLYSRKSKNLSGGMRRRLSIGISMAGNSKVVLLDEPASGVDIASAREIANVIQKVKTNRCIILTTHDLQEADLLADRIGIMSRGQLKCIGTSLHLKSRFGEGIRIELKMEPDVSSEKVHQTLFPDAHEVYRFDTTIKYEIKKEQISVGDLFLTLSKSGKDYGVSQFAISQTSLEDVFISMMRKDEIEHANEMAMKKGKK